MKVMKLVLPFVLALLAAGCASTGSTGGDAAGHIPEGLSEEQVKRAIVKSGVSHNWQMQELVPNEIRGVMDKTSHQTVIIVRYDKSSYTINYAGTTNTQGLNTDAYKRAVSTLKTDIDTNLLKAAGSNQKR